MKLLSIHSNGFSYEVKQKATKDAEEIEYESYKTSERVLVIFISVEKSDEKNPELATELASKKIHELADELGESNIVIYPYAHLSSQLSSPETAKQTLKRLSEVLSEKGYNIVRSPFGWYKAFNVNCIGHPRAETLRAVDVTQKEKEEIVVEEHPPSDFYILTPDNQLIKVDVKVDGESKKLKTDISFDFSEHENLKYFLLYELAKEREEKGKPPHTDLMRRHELSDYEPGADPGNMRWYAKGTTLRHIIEEHVYDKVVNEFGALPLDTPIMYDLDNPVIKKQVSRFPARQYRVKSGDKDLFLRYASDFGQFFLLADTALSYKNLPLRIYELAPSFRREKRGEVVALRRLRAFTMPDLHACAADIPSVLKEFEDQYFLAASLMDDFEFDYEAAFRMSGGFFEEHREWLLSLIRKRLKKPALIELFPDRYFYWILKFEFNFVDFVKKVAALSTVQIDVESAERYGITYVNDKGEKVYPVITHSSPSGAIERVVYAILEGAAIDQEKGKPPMFPLWLAPTQVRLISISNQHVSYCEELMQKVERAKIRVDLDDRDETLGKKIRQAEREWIPYILVVGDKEIENRTISVRTRTDGKTRNDLFLEDVIQEIASLIEGRVFVPLSPSLKRLSTRPTFVSM
ncbi:MAG: threonine--tRNA ligase [Promethearchaeota archaeon]